MAHLTDETTSHVHSADPKSRCNKCRELVKSAARVGPSKLGKAQSTIRADEEPLFKGSK